MTVSQCQVSMSAGLGQLVHGKAIGNIDPIDYVPQFVFQGYLAFIKVHNSRHPAWSCIPKGPFEAECINYINVSNLNFASGLVGTKYTWSDTSILHKVIYNCV